MKYGYLFLLCGWLICSVAWAEDKEPAGWFVLQNIGDVVDEEENIDEEEDKENVTEPTIAVPSDKLRFAHNNKDLDLAQKWLKRELSQNNNQNIVISPLSFYVVSALLANGVVDETLFEFSSMFSVLHLTDVNKKIKDYMVAKKGTMDVYNSLWGSVFSEHYQELMKKQLNAEIWGIKDSTSVINDWVNTRTEGLIKSIVPEKNVSQDDVYLVNAIYFKNKWDIEFDEELTKKDTFNNSNGEQGAVFMMHKNDEMQYFENDKMQAVRLFYETGDYMTVFLPKEGVTLDELVSDFTPQNMKPRFRRETVDLFLPKFDIDYEVVRPKEIYQMLGISRIFQSGNYDFAKMINFDTPRNVTDVFLKAKITVNEEKTEAAAASAVVVEKMIDVKPREVKLFKANRPFIFMINNGDFIGAFVSGNE